MIQVQKKEMAEELFTSMLGYSFNRGHAVAYAMLSAELGYFKAHFPDEFWYVTLKHEWKDDSRLRDEALYIKSGGIIFTPHVNGTALYSLQLYKGEKVIVQGLSSIKGVGEKAAFSIEEERIKNGPYTDIDNFEDRLPKRIVNSRVVTALKAAGALKFNKNEYLKVVMKYNKGLVTRE